MFRENKTLLRNIEYLIVALLVASYGSKSLANPHFYEIPVSRIQVFGNEKTQTRFILKWSKISPGQLLTLEDIKFARQNILDTSLFKRVDIKTVEDGDQVQVNIDLEEKYYTLLLPRLGRNSNGDIKSGVKLRMHNIGGANQSLNFLLEQTELSNGNNSKRYKMTYTLPQYSKPYFYQWRLGESTTFTAEDNFYNTEHRQFAAFAVSRDMYSRFFQLPLTFNVELELEKLDLDQPYPVTFNEIESGSFNWVGVQLEYNNVHQQRFRRFGRYFSLSYQQGFTELESDYLSRILEFESKIFRPLNARDSFNSRLFIGVSEDSPFNSPYYELGGGDNIRGLERDAFSGDAIVFGNFEYVIGYSAYPSFHSSLFLDIGNVYQQAQSIDLKEVYTTLGFGLRWKLTSFIKTDLFIDVAYDPESDNKKVYGGTSLIF